MALLLDQQFVGFHPAFLPVESAFNLAEAWFSAIPARANIDGKFRTVHPSFMTKHSFGRAMYSLKGPLPRGAIVMIGEPQAEPPGPVMACCIESETLLDRPTFIRADSGIQAFDLALCFVVMLAASRSAKLELLDEGPWSGPFSRRRADLNEAVAQASFGAQRVERPLPRGGWVRATLSDVAFLPVSDTWLVVMKSDDLPLSPLPITGVTAEEATRAARDFIDDLARQA